MTNILSSNSGRLATFALLFTLSGFTGLIYESIWSHYLKLLLGHAAHAQTLVLGVFMGGMALGAAICAKWVQRIKSPLLAYAAVEFATGLLALCFHPLFESVQNLAYGAIFPSLTSTAEVQAAKWILAGALILPQSILLGTTFPLMSSGVLRLLAGQPGRSISILYFSNSLGAAFGVLASGFWLVERFGMPGTMMTAGLLNVGLSILVWLLVKVSTGSTVPVPMASVSMEDRPENEKYPAARVFLGVAFLTGTASFIYEIGWIRMLSLVLGSSTHAFELMLSAFIFGLAFGGLWIRTRVDSFPEPLKVLGFVLILKGILAVATLPVYGGTFDLMKFSLSILAKSDSSYTLFNGVSHLIALLVMFPAAFCAGISLPVLTLAMVRARHGESAIGAVYAWNTLGAITGVVFAVHVGMPMLGLKNLIIAGSAIDTLTGGALILLFSAGMLRGVRRLVPIAASVGILMIAIFGYEFDLNKTASGVYRHGNLRSAQDGDIVFHKDGKTATVDVVKLGDFRGILTNGKSDAGIGLGAEVAPDESTMVLVGVLALSHNPDAQVIANIGFGSGLTTHTLLGSQKVTRVDTIEIEEQMVEGARHFAHMVARAHHDPRSNIVIDDAKSYFAGNRTQYDVVISEPSNPWVSGVSSLFSHEFYSRMRSYIRPDGLLVQWLQMYEIDSELVASMLKALGNNFEDYVIYEVGGNDIAILATPKGKVRERTAEPFGQAGVRALAHRIGTRDVKDLAVRELGRKAELSKYFDSFDVSPNSDYFPIVEYRAPKLRFLKIDARDFLSIGATHAPVPGLLRKQGPPDAPFNPSNIASKSQRPDRSNAAIAMRESFIHGHFEAPFELSPHIRVSAAYLRDTLLQCNDAGIRRVELDTLFGFGTLISAASSTPKSTEAFDLILKSRCFRTLDPSVQTWVALFRAVGLRDSQESLALSRRLLEAKSGPKELHREYLLSVAMASAASDGKWDVAKDLWRHFGKEFSVPGKLDGQLRMLVSMAYSH